jgi:beta-lactamase regulating signal transducer with metallopeptidase domain/HEAT repeat protein
VGALLFAVWAIGCVSLLAWLAAGAWSVRRIVRRARPLNDPAWQHPLYEIADRLGLSEAPELLQSDRIAIPFASGLWRCRIVLPSESETWSPDRRNAVLMHELGHVLRRDLIGHTLSRLVCALYWFHPLVWTAAQRLRAESERACDDLALGMGARPSDYAEHLLDIVSGVRERRTPSVALAMANPHEFEGRMLAILDPGVPRRGLGRGRALALAGSLALVTLVVGMTTPARRTLAKPAESTASHQTTQVTQVTNKVTSEQKTETKHEQRYERTAPAPQPKPEPQAKPTVQADADDNDALAMATGASDHDKKTDESQRITVLAKTLRTDTNVEVRRVAAWGLERYAESDVAATALAAALDADASEEVREMSAWALGSSRGSNAAVAALQKAMKGDKSRDVKRTAVWACGEMGEPSSVPGLVGQLADADPAMREVAAWSIGSCRPEHAPPALVRLLADPNRDVRISAAWALREIGDSGTADELEAAFSKEKDPDVQMALIKALGAMGDASVETLTRLVGSSNPEIRAVAVAALAGGNVSGPWPWPRPEPRPQP